MELFREENQTLPQGTTHLAGYPTGEVFSGLPAASCTRAFYHPAGSPRGDGGLLARYSATALIPLRICPTGHSAPPRAQSVPHRFNLHLLSAWSPLGLSASRQRRVESGEPEGLRAIVSLAPAHAALADALRAAANRIAFVTQVEMAVRPRSCRLTHFFSTPETNSPSALVAGSSGRPRSSLSLTWLVSFAPKELTGTPAALSTAPSRNACAEVSGWPAT